MVSFTHGEGFGRPLLEASMVNLPVIAPAWSGQLDFLDKDKSMLLPGELIEVPGGALWKGVVEEGSKWFRINSQVASKAMSYCFNNYDDVLEKSNDLMKSNRNKFTLDHMTEKLDEILTKYTSNMPSQVGLNLPKLKKVKNSEPPKVKLPKLKKVVGEEV